jgi:hypothetical protein
LFVGFSVVVGGFFTTKTTTKHLSINFFHLKYIIYNSKVSHQSSVPVLALNKSSIFFKDLLPNIISMTLVLLLPGKCVVHHAVLPIRGN